MIYQIEPRYSFGKEYCAFWDDFLTQEELDYLEFHPSWANYGKAEIGLQNTNGEVNESVRRTYVSWVDLNKESHFIWEKFSRAIAEVNRRYFNFDLTGCYEPIQLGLYKAKEQGHYDWHTDCGTKDTRVPRKLTMALLLSDPEDFEGGELQVKLHSDELINLELKKGRAWFFPSYILHRVTPVTKGIRKSAVLWVGGPQFR